MRKISKVLTHLHNHCRWLAVLVLLASNTAVADRHCSFARQSLFYAEATSVEAKTVAAAQCYQKLEIALEYLRDARVELDICSCSFAQGPLADWFAEKGAAVLVKNDQCRTGAIAVADISRHILTEVEKCF